MALLKLGGRENRNRCKEAVFTFTKEKYKKKKKGTQRQFKGLKRTKSPGRELAKGDT